MSDYLRDIAGREARRVGKPRDQLVPFGDLVSESVEWPEPGQTSTDAYQPGCYFHLVRNYCRGHVNLGIDDLWVEEVHGVVIPLPPNDPRVVELLRIRATPPEWFFARAVEDERGHIAFCVKHGRTDD